MNRQLWATILGDSGPTGWHAVEHAVRTQIFVNVRPVNGNNCAIPAAEASRPAALLVAHIVPLCSLLAPWEPGAATARMTHLFPDGP